ncbi:MAG: lactate utilization protein [Ferruginibacter sp.]
MATSPAKEKILKRIREALSNPVPLPFPHSEGVQSVYTENNEDPAVVFAEEFTKLQGKFAFCENEKDLREQLAILIKEKEWTKVYCRELALKQLLADISVPVYDDLPSCDVSLTGCEYLVARTGSIVLSAAQESGRTVSVYAPVHVCIAHEDRVVYDIKDALLGLKTKYGTAFPSFISFASGPSRTADIEKTLVTGVHGPKEVYCFLTERK